MFSFLLTLQWNRIGQGGSSSTDYLCTSIHRKGKRALRGENYPIKPKTSGGEQDQ